MKKKIEHLWSILCERSLVDEETKNITLTNVLESMQVQIQLSKDVTIGGDLFTAEKNVPVNFELVTAWKRLEEGEIKEPVRVECLDPNGKLLATYEYKVEIAKSLERFRFRTRFNGFKFTVPGNYRFVTKIHQGSGYREVGTTFFDVKIAFPNISK
ncbi:MAG: hypothetical protein ABR884_02535 [Minisyncoccia bacterium]|jgi:hypothetical protein